MTIKAALLDIDGTLMFKGRPIAGAQRTLRELRAAGLRIKFLTNISTRAPAVIAAELRANGFDVQEQEIQSAATACSCYVRRCSGLAVHLLIPESMRPLFEGARIDDEAADLVVVADIGEEFTYARLNHAFHLLRGGARLVVPHKNLFWYDDEGPRLDAGAFVVGLEAASGQPALVTGKPSSVFFHTAMDELGVSPDETIVVGDDVQTDIAGASRLGLQSVLVRTGKGALQRASDHIRPDHEIDSIADLAPLLDRIGASDLALVRPTERARLRGNEPRLLSMGRAVPSPPQEDGIA